MFDESNKCREPSFNCIEELKSSVKHFFLNRYM